MRSVPALSLFLLLAFGTAGGAAAQLTSSGTPLPGAGAMVTVTLTDAPIPPNFVEFLKQVPQTPIQVDPIALQAVLVGGTVPANEPFLATRIRNAYNQLYAYRPQNEPKWRGGLNPLVWISRARGGTLDWWRAYKAIPDAQRPLVEMFPLLYDTSKGAQPAARARSRDLMNQGIDTLMGQGDLRKGAELTMRAVTADPSNGVALYNAGVMQMALNNYEAAIKRFALVKDLPGAPQLVRERSNEYQGKVRQLFVLLLNKQGSQRRIYTDYMDAAWAMVNANQHHAAATLAGQAAVYDPEEIQAEPQLILAMICAQQNRPKEAVRWIQYGLERSRGSATRIVRELLGEAITIANSAAAAPAPATPPVETPPVEAPPATTP